MSNLENVSVLVPYRPDGGNRQRAWELVCRPYWELFDCEIIVETPEPEGPGHPGDFNHPAAINRARERATGDVLIIADADTHPGDPVDMVRLLRTPYRRVPWVMPMRYSKLSEARTNEELDAGGNARRIFEADAYEWEGLGVCWSGCVVVRTDDFDHVGGYDERIAWWGADDICFGLTMNALVGKAERHPCGCMHFWHPAPLEHNYGHERHLEQQRIVDAYVRAADDPAAIARVRWP